MKNCKFFAAALSLLVLSGCATYDRAAMSDSRVIDRPAVAYVLSAPDPTPGAGGPGGSGAGAARM